VVLQGGVAATVSTKRSRVALAIFISGLLLFVINPKLRALLLFADAIGAEVLICLTVFAALSYLESMYPLRAVFGRAISWVPVLLLGVFGSGGYACLTIAKGYVSAGARTHCGSMNRCATGCRPAL
jgi:hypothetical protein